MKAIIVNFQNFNNPDVSELSALSQDIGFEICNIIEFKSHNKPFLGKGQMQELHKITIDNQANYVIYNGFLSGLKIKLLEKYVKATILSRIDIIIRVFENRAHTQEGMLQVKLAKLLHQKSKLVRYWSHLERQRGGTRGIGGPGETQLELDKRMIADKIKHIKKQLVKIAQDRQIRAKSRTEPVISLIGYSNAGKTTLFNLLTNNTCDVSSKPFQTLDPFIRPCLLSNSQKVLISDTVGFVTQLPPFLVKAFRTTLEQIQQANVIVCVHDCTNEPNLDEITKWLKVLKVDQKPKIYAKNKSDLPHEMLFNSEDSVYISAKNNLGIEQLQQKIIQKLNNTIIIEKTLAYDDQNQLAWLMKNSINHKIDYKNDYINIQATLTDINKRKFEKLFN